MTATTLLLLGFACFRLTHLIIADRIAEPLRRWVQHHIARRYPSGGFPRKLAEALIGCPWCSGVWVAAALLVGWYGLPAIAHPLVWLLAVAGVGVSIELATRAWSAQGARR